MKKTIFVIALLYFCVEIVDAQSQEKTINEADKLIGINLIKNPDAESITDLNKPLYWEASDGDDDFVSSYGHIAGEWDYDCNTNCGLPANAGDYYFRTPSNVEPGKTNKFLYQTIDINKLKDTLAVREINFTYSAQIAGFHCDENLKCAFGYLKIEFFDTLKKSLAIYDIKKLMNEFHRVDESDGADSRMHKFEKISLTNTIPANASYAVIFIGSEQNCNTESEGFCEDAFVFFDNLSLLLSKSNYR